MTDLENTKKPLKNNITCALAKGEKIFAFKFYDKTFCC